MAQIFLSYVRGDAEKVENLYQKLSDAGFKPWMDTKDILPGERWKPCIQKAIRRSDFFLACVSTNSVNRRGSLQRGIKDALDIWQEMLENDIYLIPVRLEDCEVPESLRDFQWVNLFEEDGWTRLVKAIRTGMERRKEGPKRVRGEKGMSDEQLKLLDDSDYEEIAREIAEEMKEPDERLLSSEQPRLLGDSDYREITEEIAEETKEPDERLPNSPRSNSQVARSFVIKEWLIARSSGVLDEIIAGLIIAGILALFGVVSGVLEGTSVAWLANSGSIWYLVGSIALMGVALIAYVAWRRKRR